MEEGKRSLSLEGLLYDLYEGWHPRHYSFETESWTDNSIFSDVAGEKVGTSYRKHYSLETLKQLNVCELRLVLCDLQREVNEVSQRLVRQLKRRDHQLSRNQAKCNIVTAVLQALSPKRSVDTKLQFSLDPPTTQSGYDQWLNAMKAVARLPDGIPHHFRRKLWITLAQHHLESVGVEWEEIRKSAFNDRLNPDDDKLGLQIIKDLHRTGWSGLSGEQERILLKRVLLAYARYNKAIGYCQGFNVIAALVLEVTDYKEENALKVMIFLIEQVLPFGYFDQTLRALSVDMAVLRDLMHQRLPRLAAHLDFLQQNSETEYEPPLTNVFTMQWLLTLFATCLPKSAVFRVWDSLMLEGSEILLRTALAIWAKIGRRASRSKTADEFYGLMGPLCQELLRMNPSESNDLMQIIYSMAEFPYPGLDALRERYTWNIQPFSSTFKLLRQQVASILNSDADDSDTEKPSKCLPGFMAAEKICTSSRGPGSASDLGNLQKQYRLMKQRQKQAAVILQNAYEKGQRKLAPKSMDHPGYPSMQAEMFNHLYVGKAPPQGTFGTMNGTIPVASKAIQPSGQRKGDHLSDPFLSGWKWNQRSYASSSSQSTATPDLSLSIGGSETVVGSWTSGGSTPTASQLSPINISEDRLRLFSSTSRFLYGTSASDKRHCGLLRRCRSLDMNEWWKIVMQYGFQESCNRKIEPRIRSRSSIELRVDWDLEREAWNKCRNEPTAVSRTSPTKPVSNSLFTPTDFATKIHHQSLFSPTTDTGETAVMQLVGEVGSSGVGSLARNKISSRKPTNSTLLNKSKAILKSFDSDRCSDLDVPVFNPFPTQHQSTLIAREKKLGLYA